MLQFLETTTYDDLETFLMNETYRTHFTSAFYSSLYAHSSSTLSAIEKWEGDLNNQYTEEEWKGTISIVRFTFTRNLLRETQYKLLHCLYIAPNVLHTIKKQHELIYSVNYVINYCCWLGNVLFLTGSQINLLLLLCGTGNCLD